MLQAVPKQITITSLGSGFSAGGEATKSQKTKSLLEAEKKWDPEEVKYLL